MAERSRQYWWVSQGYNYATAIEQQTLWSLPKKGRELPDRRLLRDMRPGDLVLHYSDKYLRAVSVVSQPWRPATRPPGYNMRPGDGNDGWLVEVDVQTTGLALHFHDIRDLITTGPPGPLDRNGTPRQLYVASLTVEEADRLLEAAGAPTPDETTTPGLLGLPDTYWDDRDTDSEALTRLRIEQRHLRKHLLGNARAAACALCGRTVPDRVLVAAHIKPRRLLSDSERLKFASAAMLVCTLGCDALFEWGYLVVDGDGLVLAGRPSETDNLRVEVASRVGRACSAHNEQTRGHFAEHHDMHAVNRAQ